MKFSGKMSLMMYFWENHKGESMNVFAFFIFNCKFILIKKKKKKIGDFHAANKVIITNYSYTNFAKVICG